MYRLITSSRTKVSRQPVYEDILKLARERPGVLFLDIRCCTGVI